MVLIGTLPTLRGEDLSVANISPLKRYYELNREVLRQRHGRPLKIDIGGRERLVTEHRDVMPEAATTAFQIHLKTPGASGAPLLQRVSHGVGTDPRGVRQRALRIRSGALG